jgi:hypothetical protein
MIASISLDFSEQWQMWPGLRRIPFAFGVRRFAGESREREKEIFEEIPWIRLLPYFAER